MTLAAIRPGEWNLPLFVHITGAMLLVAALVVVATAMGAAVRRHDGTLKLARVAYRALLLASCQRTSSCGSARSGSSRRRASATRRGWGVGYTTADGGLLLVIIAAVLAWRATRRGDDAPGGAGSAVVVLSGVLLLAYMVAIWAMTTKPG
jgi:hypothetical protein